MIVYYKKVKGEWRYLPLLWWLWQIMILNTEKCINHLFNDSPCKWDPLEQFISLLNFRKPEMSWSLWLRETMTSPAMLRSGLPSTPFPTPVWSTCHRATHFHRKEPNLVSHPTNPEECFQQLQTPNQQEAQTFLLSHPTLNRGRLWLLLIWTSRMTKMILAMWLIHST